MAIRHFEDPRVLHALAMVALNTGDATAVIEHMEWLRAKGRSQNTIHDRVRLLNRLNTWLQGLPEPKTLGTATEDDLADWQRAISQMAIESIATYVGHARGYYRWLAKYKHRPDASALLVRPTKPRRLPRPITDEALIVALRMADGPVLVSLLLMACCGLRVGEVARLQRHDICDHENPQIILVHGKGGKMRTVPMPPGLDTELRQTGIPLRGPILLNSNGVPHSPVSLSHMVNRYLHDHGIVDSAHTLRHWYGTNTYRLTKDIRLVQELLGHSSPVTTAGYAAFDPEHAQVAAAAVGDKIADMLGGRRRLHAVR